MWMELDNEFINLDVIAKVRQRQEYLIVVTLTGQEIGHYDGVAGSRLMNWLVMQNEVTTREHAMLVRNIEYLERQEEADAQATDPE